MIKETIVRSVPAGDFEWRKYRDVPNYTKGLVSSYVISEEVQYSSDRSTLTEVRMYKDGMSVQKTIELLALNTKAGLDNWITEYYKDKNSTIISSTWEEVEE